MARTFAGFQQASLLCAIEVENCKHFIHIRATTELCLPLGGYFYARVLKAPRGAKAQHIMIRALYFQVSYHRFPSDAGLKKKWIATIKRDEGPLFRVSKGKKCAPRISSRQTSAQMWLVAIACSWSQPYCLFSHSVRPRLLEECPASELFLPPSRRNKFLHSLTASLPSTLNVAKQALMMRTSFHYKRLF